LQRTFLFTALAAVAPAWAGIYSGPTDITNAIDPAIPSGSTRFVEWANAIDASPNRTYFASRGSSTISTTGYNSLGDLDPTEINAGASPGYLTVKFPTGIRNGGGADFAVFENGLVYPSTPYLGAELAYVEVSSNGTDFARFPSISTNTEYAGAYGQAYGGFDVTSIYNLAGKHANGYGTPFNLDDLLNDPKVLRGEVDLNNVQFVKLIDIPGNGAFKDSFGNGILDQWLTTGTGGFDFRLPAGQGVGVLNVAVPEPTSLAALATAGAIVLRRRNRVARTPTGIKQ
jgi:hypothetical protein